MINYRKNIVRELHGLKHRKKYLYQTLYHSKEKRWPEDSDWLDPMKKEYDIILEKILLLEKILEVH